MGRPVVTRPSCEAFDHCVSAAFTWPAATPYRTFAAVTRSVKSWAARNHLGRPLWICDPHRTGVSGAEDHPGCEAGFVPGPSWATSVFVAVRFTDPDSLRFPPPRSDANGVPPPQLDGALVRSISSQVVDGMHPFGKRGPGATLPSASADEGEYAPCVRILHPSEYISLP